MYSRKKKRTLLTFNRPTSPRLRRKRRKRRRERRKKSLASSEESSSSYGSYKMQMKIHAKMKRHQKWLNSLPEENQLVLTPYEMFKEKLFMMFKCIAYVTHLVLFLYVCLYG